MHLRQCVLNSAIGLAPAHLGLVRAIVANPGLSQQAVADRVGVHPSRIVALIDDLERHGFVERRRNPEDRRLHALYPAAGGMLRQIGDIAAAHERDMCTALSSQERATLRELLVRMAEQQGLEPGVHPGYRRLPAAHADSRRGRQSRRPKPPSSIGVMARAPRSAWDDEREEP